MCCQDTYVIVYGPARCSPQLCRHSPPVTTGERVYHDHVPPPPPPTLSDTLGFPFTCNSHAVKNGVPPSSAVFQPLHHHLEYLCTTMQAAGTGAADPDATVNSSSSSSSSSTADVDDSDGAGERMERTVPSEQQDRTSSQEQQQQTSLSPSGVLGECHRKTVKEKCPVTVQWRSDEDGYVCSLAKKKKMGIKEIRLRCMDNMVQ